MKSYTYKAMNEYENKHFQSQIGGPFRLRELGLKKMVVLTLQPFLNNKYKCRI